MIDKSKGLLTYYDDFSRLRKLRPETLAGIWVLAIGIIIALLFGAAGV
jgi:hypothetical protein